MGALGYAILALARFNQAFARAAGIVALTLVALMTGAVLVQVVFRYGLNAPLSWTEEFAIFAMIWMAFLVAPIAYRAGAFVAIEVVRDLFKGRAQAVLQILLTILVLALVVVLFRHSLIYVQRGFNSTASSLPIRMGWIYLSMPIGLFGLFTVGVELLLRAARALVDPNFALDLPSGEHAVETAHEVE